MPGLPLLTTPLTTPGALLQDYFNDLCLYLRKNDVIFLKNCEQAEPLSPRGGWGLSHLTRAGAFWRGDASPGWWQGLLFCPDCGFTGALSSSVSSWWHSVVSAAGLEALRHDTDSRTRRFYLNYWNDAVELSYYVQD